MGKYMCLFANEWTIKSQLYKAVERNNTAFLPREGLHAFSFLLSFSNFCRFANACKPHEFLLLPFSATGLPLKESVAESVSWVVMNPQRHKWHMPPFSACFFTLGRKQLSKALLKSNSPSKIPGLQVAGQNSFPVKKISLHETCTHCLFPETCPQLTELPAQKVLTKLSWHFSY